MSPKIKNKSLPPIRVDEATYDLTVKCAAEADEFLSVYIRKAVKMRNKQLEDSTRKNNTVSKPMADSTVEKGFKKLEGNDYFKPCPKGGK